MPSGESGEEAKPVGLFGRLFSKVSSKIRGAMLNHANVCMGIVQNKQDGVLLC